MSDQRKHNIIASVAVVPICGSIFAVSYDVGYFSGIDIGFFGFFNLSEHLIFAFEAIPFAIILVLFIFITAVYFGSFSSAWKYWVEYFRWAFGGDYGSATMRRLDVAFSGYFESRYFLRKVVFVTSCVALASVAPFIWRGLDRVFDGVGILFVFVIMFLLFTPLAFFTSAAFRAVSLSAAAIIALTLVAFFRGSVLRVKPLMLMLVT